MEAAIVTEELGRRFGKVVAVADVSLCVEPGEVLALLGPNGAGKTTTLLMLAAMLAPSSGRAKVAGYDVSASGASVRHNVGIMLDEPGFYGDMAIEDYLLFFARLYGLHRVAARPRLVELLERFGLESRLRDRLDTLSKGMRQKVALTRALLHRPCVLLLDEPTSALDPLSARGVRRHILDRKAAGDAIIISTHNLPEAEAVADRVAIVARGRVRRVGSPAELRRAPDGVEAFAVTVAGSPDGHIADLARLDHVHSIELAESGSGHYTMMYRTASPHVANADLVARLVHRGARVLGLEPRPRSLADVYLETIEEAERWS